jgi:protein SCO1/2
MWRALGLVVIGLALSDQVRSASERDVHDRVSVTQRLGQSVPASVTLADEQGVRHPLGAYLQGRPAVIALVYFECPNLCTLTLNGLADSLKHVGLAAGRDYTVLAISIDPREGPALAATKLATFASSYGGGASCPGCDLGWHFLTGRPQDIRAVADALGYRYFWDASQSQYAHPAGIVLVSAEGRIVQYFGGLEFPPSELRRALDAAAAGRTGNLAERLWLLCFHYAALTGKYSDRISVLLRILALATVAGLGILLMRLKRDANE